MTIENIIKIMETLDLMHSGKTAYGEAASIIKRQQVEIDRLTREARWHTEVSEAWDVIKQSTPASIEFKIKEKVKP